MAIVTVITTLNQESSQQPHIIDLSGLKSNLELVRKLEWELNVRNSITVKIMEQTDDFAIVYMKDYDKKTDTTKILYIIINELGG